MSRRFIALTVSIAALVASGLSAQAKPEARPSQTIGGVAEALVASPSTTLRLQGTIDQYDLGTGVLTMATSTGVVRFPVAPTARLRRSGRKLEAVELKALSGHRAAVRYTESQGHRTVESVSVFEEGDRIAR